MAIEFPQLFRLRHGASLSSLMGANGIQNHHFAEVFF